MRFEKKILENLSGFRILGDEMECRIMLRSKKQSNTLTTLLLLWTRLPSAVDRKRRRKYIVLVAEEMSHIIYCEKFFSSDVIHLERMVYTPL